MITPALQRETALAKWEIREDRARNLPSGQLSVTLAYGGSKKPSVLAAYLLIPGNETGVAKTRTFDDDRVAIDFAEDGRVIGMEFLTRRALSELPELFHELRNYNEQGRPRDFLWIAFQTVMSIWRSHEIAFGCFAPKSPDRQKPGAETPSFQESWESPVTDPRLVANH